MLGDTAPVSQMASASSDVGKELIPAGHKLDDVRVRTVDNGFTVSHSTSKVNPSKQEDYETRHRDFTRVFESPTRAIAHVRRVLSAGRNKGGRGKGKA